MPTGDPVTASMPFDEMFGGASYSYTARAFNDDAPGETASLDLNGILFLRAIGSIRGEQKLLEVKARAISTLGLINCVGDDTEACPDIKGEGISVDEITDYLPGREPHLHDQLLPLKPPLSDSGNYYRDTTKLNDEYYTNVDPISHPTGLQVFNYTGDYSDPVEDWKHYIVSGNVSINNAVSNTVIFSTGTIEVFGKPTLTNVTLVAQDDVLIHGASRLISLLPLPAVIAGDTVDFGSSAAEVTGNIYSLNVISLNPITVNGLLISDNVQLQGNSTLITDRRMLDSYAFMPGFDYSDEDKGVSALPDGWRELQ